MIDARSQGSRHGSREPPLRDRLERSGLGPQLVTLGTLGTLGMLRTLRTSPNQVAIAARRRRIERSTKDMCPALTATSRTGQGGYAHAQCRWLPRWRGLTAQSYTC
jgi:hypothetical protein